MIRHTKKPFYVYSIITRNQSVLTWGLYSINNAPTAVGGRDAAYRKGLYRELRPLYSSAHSSVNDWNTSAYSAASHSWWLSLKLDKIRSVHLNKLPIPQWPRGLRRRSSAARLLRLWVRIPPGAWMFVCLYVVSVMCCQVEVSATGWSLAQRDSTDCGAS